MSAHQDTPGLRSVPCSRCGGFKRVAKLGVTVPCPACNGQGSMVEFIYFPIRGDTR